MGSSLAELISVLLLIPAMQINLLDARSNVPLLSRLATNKLDSCLAILKELQDSHPEASIICNTFSSSLHTPPVPNGTPARMAFPAGWERSLAPALFVEHSEVAGLTEDTRRDLTNKVYSLSLSSVHQLLG